MNFKTYLKQVYKKWRLFYYFIVIFIFGTFTCAIVIGQTIMPFHIYSMYSYVFPKNAKITSFKILINNKEFNTFSLLKNRGDILRGNINRFIYLKKNNYKDKYYFKLREKVGNKLPDIIYFRIFSYEKLDDKFTSWLKLYLENTLSVNIYSIKIYAIEFKLNNEYLPLINNQSLILDSSEN